ncbi:hypothetical protein EK904_014111, partial [Melospiza melodia maxima]
MLSSLNCHCNSMDLESLEQYLSSMQTKLNLSDEHELLLLNLKRKTCLGGGVECNCSLHLQLLCQTLLPCCVLEAASPTFQRGFPQLCHTLGMILTKNLNKNYLGRGCFLHAVKRCFCAGSQQNLCTIPVPQLWDLFLGALGVSQREHLPAVPEVPALANRIFRFILCNSTGSSDITKCWGWQGQSQAVLKAPRAAVPWECLQLPCKGRTSAGRGCCAPVPLALHCAQTRQGGRTAPAGRAT